MPGPSQAQTLIYNSESPATWTDAQLASEVIFTCAHSDSLAEASNSVKQGVGGVVLIGSNPPNNIKKQLQQLIQQAPKGRKPFIASDEEGGSVQRLRDVIFKLPSAEYMGRHWSEGKIRRVAQKYGTSMRALGVTMNLAPVADLLVPNHYIAMDHRSFSKSPWRVAQADRAWTKGMLSAKVIPVVKHWPGHGHANNSHISQATIPSFNLLKKDDLIPFESEFSMHIPAVMVGHLMSSGLTEKGLPASESASALHYLRSKVGKMTLIMSDSLSMHAATAPFHNSVSKAVIGSLKAGIDVALVCQPRDSIGEVTRAITSKQLNRRSIVASVQRILYWKHKFGVLPALSKPSPTPSASPSSSAMPSTSPSTALSISPNAGNH